MTLAKSIAGARQFSVRRIVLVLAATLLALASFFQALAGMAQTRNLEFDSGFGPWRGVTPTVMADRLIAAQNDQVDFRMIDALARASILSQAVNPRALRLSGIVADVRAQPRRASQLMHLSNAVSRRDVSAQIWLINEAARTGDAAAALEHYDIAMRANDDIWQLLFPVLTIALEQPELGRRFVPYVKADPNWLAPFLNFAFANTKRPEIFAGIMVHAGGFPNSAPHDGQERALITQLVVQKKIAAARRTFAALHPDRTYLFRSLAFDDFNNAPASAMFGWQTVDAPTYGAALVKRDGAPLSELEVFGGPGTRAIVASKLLSLPGGNYVLRPSYGYSAMAAGGLAFWQVQCMAAGANTTVWESADVAPAADSKPPPEGFTVPAGCDAVYLNLVFAGGTGQSGSQLTVRSVSLAAP